jgi:hypothetical protein
MAQVPAGHNNLAFAVFCQGRIDEAIRIQSTGLRIVPMENIFGMSNLVYAWRQVPLIKRKLLPTR